MPIPGQNNTLTESAAGTVSGAAKSPCPNRAGFRNFLGSAGHSPLPTRTLSRTRKTLSGIRNQNSYQSSGAARKRLGRQQTVERLGMRERSAHA